MRRLRLEAERLEKLERRAGLPLHGVEPLAEADEESGNALAGLVGAPSNRLSSTLIPPNTLVSWNVRTSPRFAIACGGRPKIDTPIEDDPTSVGAVEARDYVEERGLARSVRADQSADRACLTSNVAPDDGAESFEGEVHVFDLEDR